jgi:hypothetical protein
MVQVLVKVRDLKAGDRFRDTKGGTTGWDALADAEMRGDGGVVCRVQYVPDGGIGTREWAPQDADWQIAVERMT